MFKWFTRLFKKYTVIHNTSEVTVLSVVYEPLTCNRWVLHIDGLDSYIVKSVTLPTLRATPIMGCTDDKLAISVYMSQNKLSDVYGLLDRMKFEAEQADDNGYIWTVSQLKFLSAVGTPVATWSMRTRPVTVTFDTLNYASSELFTAYIEFDVKEWTMM